MSFDSKQAPEKLARAGAALALGRRLLERALWKIRERSLDHGQIQSEKLDQSQLVGFDAALSFAELTASDFALQYARRALDSGAGDMESHVALLFPAETLANLVRRVSAEPGVYGVTR